MKNYSPFNLDDITLTITAIDPENHHIGTEMPNPEGVPTSRMNMAFTGSSRELIELYTCDEPEDQDAYLEFSVPAMAYGEGCDTPAGFVRSIITHIAAYRDAFCINEDALKAGNDSYCRSTPGVIMDNEPNEISNTLIAEFIKRIVPERTGFSLDELDLLNDYRWLCYSTAKWLNCAINGWNYHTLYEGGNMTTDTNNIPMFDSVDDIIDYLTNYLSALESQGVRHHE